MSEPEKPYFSKRLFVHVVSDYPEPELLVTGADEKMWISGEGIELLLDMDTFFKKQTDRRKMLENENLPGHVLWHETTPASRAVKHRLIITVSIDPLKE